MLVTTELSPTQQERADTIMSALAHKYERPRATFSVLSINSLGSQAVRNVIAWTSTVSPLMRFEPWSGSRGLPWSEVIKPDGERFKVRVGAEVIDTRAALDLDVARAIVASNPAIQDEKIWLTGQADEVSDNGAHSSAPIALVRFGVAVPYVANLRDTDVGFRPAVEI